MERRTQQFAKAESSSALLWDRVGRLETHLHHSKHGKSAAGTSSGAAHTKTKSPGSGGAAEPPAPTTDADSAQSQSPLQPATGDDLSASPPAAAPIESSPPAGTAPITGLTVRPPSTAGSDTLPLRSPTSVDSPLSGADVQATLRRNEQNRIRALLADRDRMVREREAARLSAPGMVVDPSAGAVPLSDAKQAEEDDRWVAEQQAKLAKLDAEERAAAAGGSGSGIGSAGGGTLPLLMSSTPLASSAASSLSFHALAALLDETMQHKLDKYETKITTKLTTKIHDRITEQLSDQLSQSTKSLWDREKTEEGEKQTEREKKWSERFERHNRHLKVLMAQVDRLEKEKMKQKVDAAANLLLTQPPTLASPPPGSGGAAGAGDPDLTARVKYLSAQTDTLFEMLEVCRGFVCYPFVGCRLSVVDWLSCCCVLCCIVLWYDQTTKKSVGSVTALTAQARQLDVRVFDWEGKLNELDDKVKLLGHFLSRLKQRDDFASIVGRPEHNTSSSSSGGGLLLRRDRTGSRASSTKRSARRTAASDSKRDESSDDDDESDGDADRKRSTAGPASGKIERVGGAADKTKGTTAAGATGASAAAGGSPPQTGAAAEQRRMQNVLTSFEDNLDSRTLQMVSRALVTDPTLTVQQLEAKTKFLVLSCVRQQPTANSQGMQCVCVSNPVLFLCVVCCMLLCIRWILRIVCIRWKKWKYEWKN